jgi:hypothetical protein
MKLKKGSAAAKAYMAKIRAKRKVGAVAKTKTGKPAKRLNKAQSDYNKDVDAYKYFVVVNGKVTEGYEYKSDAIDAANEYEPKAKILTKQGLKKANIVNTSSQWKYTLGATKKVVQAKKDYIAVFQKGNTQKIISVKAINKDNAIFEAESQKGYNELNTFDLIDIYETNPKKIGSTLKLKANEKRLGATKKDVKPTAKSYHKDTKSHNVNIKVVSGFNSLNTKQKRLYNKLNKDYEKSGLYKIVSFSQYLDAKIESAINSRKSTTDLYAIKDFTDNDFY